MDHQVHVFAGTFANREAACLYSEQQWEPEPDESVSDEEYTEWEDRNPIWQLRDDLGCVYLSPDFIETIFGDEKFAYLQTLLVDPAAIHSIQKSAGRDTNTLVLVFTLAFAEFGEPTLASTPVLTYCGRHTVVLKK